MAPCEQSDTVTHSLDRPACVSKATTHVASTIASDPFQGTIPLATSAHSQEPGGDSSGPGLLLEGLTDSELAYLVQSGVMQPDDLELLGASWMDFNFAEGSEGADQQGADNEGEEEEEGGCYAAGDNEAGAPASDGQQWGERQVLPLVVTAPVPHRPSSAVALEDADHVLQAEASVLFTGESRSGRQWD